MLEEYTGQPQTIIKSKVDYWSESTAVKVWTESGVEAIIWTDGPLAGQIEDGN